jgi:hypothetical protein
MHGDPDVGGQHLARLIVTPVPGLAARVPPGIHVHRPVEIGPPHAATGRRTERFRQLTAGVLEIHAEVETGPRTGVEPVAANPNSPRLGAGFEQVGAWAPDSNGQNARIRPGMTRLGKVFTVETRLVIQGPDDGGPADPHGSGFVAPRLGTTAAGARGFADRNPRERSLPDAASPQRFDQIKPGLAITPASVST